MELFEDKCKGMVLCYTDISNAAALTPDARAHSLPGTMPDQLNGRAPIGDNDIFAS
jgi:hypothetical protein